MLASSILEPLTVGWVVFSLMVGFVIALLPKLDRVLSLLVAVTSAVYAGLLLTANAPLPLTLLDRFG
ncbi:MAG: cation:proton antiporter, partial [Limnothrix sp.]|nr:cation:proton antiporter [Limnothrix sp.]